MQVFWHYTGKMLKNWYFQLAENEKIGKNLKTGYHGNGGTFECYEDFYRSFTSKLMYMQNIKKIWIHACRNYMVNFWSLQIIDVKFPTFYTTIPHQKLKDRLALIIQNAFIFKNGNRRYKYLVLGNEETYFVKEHTDKNKYSEDDIIKILELLVDNLFLPEKSSSRQSAFQLVRCANVSLFSLASRFNLTYRYIDDVLSIKTHRIRKLSGPAVSCWTRGQRHQKRAPLLLLT